ncbi:ABC transporter ATP-binding protein [Streptomyces sp. ACA25]|uniref:ABC transporter ATP-binding protein n=1 Tax=Streptomyces sp. ACA25 TaxID=3022596 RepID=UPI00230811AA|nr:ABC transporter ATP-binding protein [Streptomyces sp. ACA25]MDB1090022.1 ABC transporter ATP-binding protein [Streptomyces sp. ACA25]
MNGAPSPTVSGPSLLLGSARRTRGRLTALVSVMVLRTGTGLTVPALLALSVDAVLSGSGTAVPALGWGAVVLVGALLDTVIGPLSASASARSTHWLRLRSARHFLGLGAEPPLPAGEGVTHLTQAAPQAGSLPAALASWGVAVGGGLVAFTAVWVIDWRTGLVLTLAVPVTLVVAKVFVGRAIVTHDAYLAAQASIATRLLTALAGARTIRASGTLHSETARVLAPLPDVAAAGRRMWRLQKGMVWQLGLLTALTEAAALAAAGVGVAHGRISPGELLAIVGYLGLAFQGLYQIEGLYGLAEARSAANRIAGALSRPAVRYGPVSGTDGPGTLTLRDVTVRKGGGVVLDRLRLDVVAGSSVALVGRTGVGKTLLARLPGRLTDPDEGEVLLDGVPVRELTRQDLRSAVTYAFERPELIGATVRDVISYGRPELTAEAVTRAARAAGADGFIRRLPDGYETPLTHAPMSGGERQRLGLARTLAREARVYVLDDATSGLDTVTEAEVSEAVTTALTGRTRLVIAHRAATAARCDRVAWLADGRIRALAPHAELWHDPEYRAVFSVPGRQGEGPTTVDEEAECPTVS